MILLRSILVGAAMSLLVSYLLSAQEQTHWDLIAILDFQVSGHVIHWSWPVFAFATIAVWLMQKVTQT